MITTEQETIQSKVAQFSGPADVLCLTALAQPLVSEMQEVIRFQAAQLQRAAAAIEHCLGQIREIDQVRHTLGAATQTFEDLTSSLAEIRGMSPDQVRDHFIPGSASIHRKSEEE